MLIKLAWRSLWRRKRRTFITCFTVAGGILLSVIFTGSGDYTYTQIIDTSATMGLGHITVEPKGYNDIPTLQKRISNASNAREEALKIPRVVAAAERITGMAMFASAAKSVGGVFFAVDPAHETPKINTFLRAMVEGEMLSESDGRQIVIGAKMAEKLKIGLGRKLVYTMTDVDGEIVSEVGRVSGIFKTGVEEVDGAFALIPIDRVRKVLKYAPDEASLVAVFIDDQRKVDEVGQLIAAQVGNSDRDVLTWKETQKEVSGMVKVDRTGNYLSQFLVGLLIAAGILNTIFMSVLERQREFGVMLAVGMRPGSLFRLVVLESLFIAIVGLIMGIILTAPFFFYLYNYGLDLRQFADNMEGYAVGGTMIDPVMKVRLFKESAIAILSGVFGLTILAGLYPAWKAASQAPVESLKTI
ncbi:MAG: FtsX-like permease family protein [Nitrospinota bacterium]|nr:FtsX-like permease family protein [Nitrospinota bacterium]MDH5757559.1 FtsX-like permease family protein [Nitrospinota bacterium]